MTKVKCVMDKCLYNKDGTCSKSVIHQEERDEQWTSCGDAEVVKNEEEQ